MSQVRKKMSIDFTCVHETIPAPAVEVDVIFRYARWLQKNNQLKRERSVDREVERLYRIASENGHYKANINLQNGAMRGTFRLRNDEYLRFSQALTSAGVATGYYFIAIFLERGVAGLEKDTDMALRYYRKAADGGSADAQYYVGEKLEPYDMAPDTAVKMYRCAAEQGNRQAPAVLGFLLKLDHEYSEALNVFQLGVAAGDAVAALALEEAFRAPPPSNELRYLGQQEDLERATRYKKIGKILHGYSYASPTVAEINDIVPLPPADLPPWDGTLQWLEARLANVPPEQPSEALIDRLATAKGLDPATGKPKPGSPVFTESNFPVMTCHTGEPCPETGYWKMLMNSWSDDIRYFEEGEIMPAFEMTMTESRLWPFSDKCSVIRESIGWGLLG